MYFYKNQLKLWVKENYKINSFFWNDIYCSERLTNLLYSYDFYAITSNKIEGKLFTWLIYKHHIINNIYIKHLPIKKISITSIKANLLSNLIFKNNIKKTIKLIKLQLAFQIDENGFHKSYNSTYQAEYINHLQEIKNILLFYKIEDIKELNFQIKNMTSILNNLFHKDNSLALFNGSHNGLNKYLNKIIKQVDDLKNPDLYKIKNGLVIYNNKNNKLFFDVIKPLDSQINQSSHASTLSFEFSSKKEKIITNCGSIIKDYGKDPEYLRYSAAHSTVILNNTNIFEISKKNSYLKMPKNITYKFSEDNKSVFFDASHDGYKNNYKKIIKRKITIDKDKNNIFGEDSIIPLNMNSKKDLYNIRFHLMPHCQCNITNSKKKVIIKTKNKNTWVFESGNEITVEESIFINQENRIQQTKQIVISGFVRNTKKIELWSIKEA